MPRSGFVQHARTLVLAAMLSSSGALAFAEPGSPHVPRIRPVDDFAAELLAEGVARSSTFRHLVSAVEAADVIVYVRVWRPSDALRPRDTCVRFIGASGGFRFLHVSLNHDNRLPRNALISRLGHELRHVLEVVEAPDVRNPQAMSRLYERIGFRVGNIDGVYRAFDSVSAREAEHRVRTELE